MDSSSLSPSATRKNSRAHLYNFPSNDDAPPIPSI